MRRALLTALAVASVAAGPAAIGLAQTVPTLAPTIVYVPDQYHTGGAYTAIEAAPDGRVYIGTTIYDGYAHLLEYTPASNRFESVAEMSAATRERNPGPYAQAKIHTKPAIGPDGRVYFGTKSGKRAKDPRWQEQYPGGHLLVYDPRTRTTTDLGIIKPRVSIITVGLDRSRGLVYAVTDPENRFVVYDPRTRAFSDRGQFGPPGREPSRYLPVLANGDAFHPMGEAAMSRYSAAVGRVEQVPLAITGGGTYEPPYALAPDPDGRRFWGVGKESGQLYLFEPREREIGVRIVGVATPDGFAPPGVHYTMTPAPDGAVYYTAMLQRGGVWEFFIVRGRAEGGRPQAVGRVAPLPRPPAGYRYEVSEHTIIQGSTVTPDGTLIVMQAYPLRLLVFRGLARR
jgi:hypothetical protein